MAAELLDQLSDAIGELPSDLPEKPVESKSDRDVVNQPVAVNPSKEGLDWAIGTWEMLFKGLLVTNEREAVQRAERAFESAGLDDKRLRIAVIAATTLLSADARRFWRLMQSAIAENDVFSKAVALACARTRMEGTILLDLEVDDLAEAYRWLAAHFPPQEDAEPLGVHFVSPEQQARQLRDSLLRRIAEHGTPEAVQALARLREEEPDRLFILSTLLLAKANQFAAAWSPPTPEELASLLVDASRRLVRTSEELTDLLVEVISQIADDLPPHGELLWDRIRASAQTDPAEGKALNEKWLPKPEAAISAYVAHELDLRLVNSGIAVNREVLVLPRDPYGGGDRTDIQVQATMRDDPIRGIVPSTFTSVVELKGPWNENLLEAQRDQLALRYLPEANAVSGIYLVGWFPLEHWTEESDYRRRIVERIEYEALQESLVEQAKEILNDLKVTSIPIVLTIPRPHKLATLTQSEDAKEPAGPEGEAESG